MKTRRTDPPRPTSRDHSRTETAITEQSELGSDGSSDSHTAPPADDTRGKVRNDTR